MEHILIVEDMRLVADDVAITVKGFGYDVVGIASNKHDAVDIAKKHRVSVALLDLNLDGKFEGPGLGKILNEKYGTHVIFISAYPEDRLGKLDFEYNYLVKPYSSSRLQYLLNCVERKKEE